MAAKSYYYLATQPTSFPNSPAPLVHETRREDSFQFFGKDTGYLKLCGCGGLGNLKAGTLSLRRFQLEELERATKNFSDDSLLGSGAFGNVYKGTFELEGTALAIKRAHAESYQNTEEFRNEVNLLSKVKHRNLVGLVGFCEQAGAKRTQMLVYEYVPNGSLLDYITGKGGRSLTWRQRVNIAIGAAKVENEMMYVAKMQARPSLESGRVEEILDANLLTDSCDMEMMLKMGELGLRCVVKNPKDRPTMTRVWQELEEALYLADNFVDKEPSKDYWRSSSSSRRSMDHGPRRSYENSQSFVSIDGVRFQRFHVEMDSIFFHSTSMKCLEAASVNIDIDKNNLRGISEETSKEEIS
ncbi:hypothetical protein H0E87_010343 [Populus deltoides]|uniref:non-specific serine/threonine protein kinase n=1 Tax=Populus deltoides TaxID=3696 RepID=A0A8T2YSS1_POPDE|nr:hypothetical protein H0E87_010343 [Populus deltoides]